MTLRIEKLEAFVYRAPIDTPVQTSFGTLRDRPAVFVRATDADGVEGWGEVWCNFPTIGAEHRVQAQGRAARHGEVGRLHRVPAGGEDRILSTKTASLSTECDLQLSRGQVRETARSRPGEPTPAQED